MKKEEVTRRKKLKTKSDSLAKQLADIAKKMIPKPYPKSKEILEQLALPKVQTLLRQMINAVDKSEKENRTEASSASAFYSRIRNIFRTIPNLPM